MNQPLIIHMGAIILGVVLGLIIADSYSTTPIEKSITILIFALGFGLVGKFLSRKMKQ